MSSWTAVFTARFLWLTWPCWTWKCHPVKASSTSTGWYYVFLLLFSFWADVTFPVHFVLSGQKSENIQHNIALHNQREGKEHRLEGNALWTWQFSALFLLFRKRRRFFRSKQTFITVVWNQWNCKGNGGRQAWWYSNKWGKQIINTDYVCWRLTWAAEQVVQDKNFRFCYILCVFVFILSSLSLYMND